jgi:hypothetical protein
MARTATRSPSTNMSEIVQCESGTAAMTPLIAFANASRPRSGSTSGWWFTMSSATSVAKSMSPLFQLS